MDLRLVHVVCDFRPWDVILKKVRYFVMLQIHIFKELEVKHELEHALETAKDLNLPDI